MVRKVNKTLIAMESEKWIWNRGLFLSGVIGIRNRGGQSNTKKAT